MGYTAIGHSRLGTPSDTYDTSFYGQPLGKALGSGNFTTVYESPSDRQAVIKVLKSWTKELRHRFLEIYNVIIQGRPFYPGNGDEYIYMIALEVRNLAKVNQLRAPKAEHFTGWFTMTKIQDTPIWKTTLYKKHPFSVPFQLLIKTAFHLAIDEIEYTVKKYSIEHRGIAVQMTWDGRRYVRGQDHLVWQDSGAGEKYTPEEFRGCWITWMVKTEYEANMSRKAIMKQDGEAFLRDVDW
ncbi:hypothetical protein GYMLUDRAFT_89293 [Collybiopsis luxurians FD-317 M1]|uniref:Uncharacterized protein n=1 Tax=Collybiopsis luxurians FD-317 M1 TaxID=944289 RepID=A0A0D0BY38_9AGAR|nr:hypothetical protein GYMLUDRAFT_89293 [Collybiopsis luxurians FD-317 M1]